MAQVLVHASPHPHSHPCVRLDRLLSLYPSPCSSPCVSPISSSSTRTLTCTSSLHCGFHRGNIPPALRQLRSLVLWPQTPLSQVMSPTSLTISTTRRPLKSSSRSNPATQCLRTCLTRNSATRPSEIHKHEFKADDDRRSIQKIEWSYRLSTR